MTGEAEEKEMVSLYKDVKNDRADKPIEDIEFEKMEADGCTGHPGIKNHQIIAEELNPFYRELLEI